MKLFQRNLSIRKEWKKEEKKNGKKRNKYTSIHLVRVAKLIEV